MIDFGDRLQGQSRRLGRRDAWYLRSDSYSIRTVDLPEGLEGDDVRAYLKRKAGSLFPYEPSDLALEILRGEGRRCSVVAARPSELDAGRLGRQASRIIAAWSLRGTGMTDGARLVILPSWREAVVYREGLPVRASSISLEADVSDIIASLMSDGSINAGGTLEIACDDVSWPLASAAATRAGLTDTAHIPLDGLDPGPGVPGLFPSEERSRRLKNILPFLRVALVGASALAALVIIQARLNDRTRELEKERATIRASIDDIQRLEERKKILLEKQETESDTPPSAILALTALARSGDGTMTVRRVSVTNGKIEAEVRARDALRVLENVENNTSFSDLSIRSIVPKADGFELFTLSGVFDEN